MRLSGHFAVPIQQNGFIYAKIFGGFDKIRSSVGSILGFHYHEKLWLLNMAAFDAVHY